VKIAIRIPQPPGSAAADGDHDDTGRDQALIAASSTMRRGWGDATTRL